MKTLLSSLKDLFSQKNEFFELARTGKRITHIAIAIPMIIVFLLGGFILTEGVVFQILLKNPDIGPIYREFYNLFISFGFIIFLVWLWVRFFEKRSFRTMGFVGKNGLKKYFLRLFYGNNHVECSYRSNDHFWHNWSERKS